METGEHARRRHEPFRFRTAEGLIRKAAALRLDLPCDADITPLLEPATIAGVPVPNRIAVQPMEGFDGDERGAPGELTIRRYRRYGAGMSGLIWFEATAVSPDGRSNPRALMLTPETQPAFRALADATREAASESCGRTHRPFLVLQLTHTGRLGMPAADGRVRIACRNPHLDRAEGLAVLWRDEQLDVLRDRFIECARLAIAAGFDAVDIKACHGYLVSELLGAHTRTGSRYGGTFENRARLLLDIVSGVREAVPEARVAVRLNATDLMPYPYGFGMAADGSDSIDLTEPRALVRALSERGCCLLNVTIGVPRYAPHIGRPFDRPVAGTGVPPEHPLVGVTRLIDLAGALQQASGAVPVVGTGYSWLRQFWPNVGAAVVKRGLAAFVGLGRGAFAYPDAPSDLVHRGTLDRTRCCTTCSRCVELMRHSRPTGCVVRDRLYARIHRAMTLGQPVPPDAELLRLAGEGRVTQEGAGDDRN